MCLRTLIVLCYNFLNLINAYLIESIALILFQEEKKSIETHRRNSPYTGWYCLFICKRSMSVVMLYILKSDSFVTYLMFDCSNTCHSVI